MGSAIGNYIHLNWPNYKKYGIARVYYGKNPTDVKKLRKMDKKIEEEDYEKRSDIDKGLALIEERKKRFSDLSDISNDRKDTLEDLENFLNYISGNANHYDGADISEKELEKIFNKIAESFSDRFIKEGSASVNKSNLSIDATRPFDITTEEREILRQGKYIKSGNPYIKTFLSTIKYIEKALMEMGARDNTLPLAKYHNIINDMYAKLSDLSGIEDSVLREIKMSSSKSKDGKTLSKYEEDSLKTLSEDVKAKLRTRLKDSGKVTVESLESDLNKMLGELRMSTAFLKGTFFEYLIAALPLMIKGKAADVSIEAIREIVEKSMTGSAEKGTQIEIDTSGLYNYNAAGRKALESLYGEKYIQIEDSSIYQYYKATPDKVDVELEWKNTPLHISAKNINFSLHNDISLVSGTSLLTNLLALNEPRYVNHVLNMIADHQRSKSEMTKYKAIAMDSLKICLLELAFKGYKNTAEKADVFIINDNSTGKVRVIDINSIIKAIVNSSENIDSYVSFNDEFLNMQLKNKKVKNKNSGQYANQRILNLLVDLRNIKLHIALKPYALDALDF